MKADYGIDAPGVVRNLFLAAAACTAMIWILPTVTIGQVNLVFRPMWRNTAIGCAAGSALMLAYSKFMKFRHRDRILSFVQWRGDEHVLDVGTGSGLLLIGAAKKLTTGRATGIDVWSGKDLSGNTREKTLQNAEIEGVKDRVEVLDGDATAMNFADGTFDVIVSNAVIHNIPSREARNKACREIARVLKPAGIAVISDFIHTSQYQKEFARAGLESAGSVRSWSTFPPMGVLVVKKKSS